MFVKDFVDSMEGQFPDMFLDCLPTECFECGSPMEMSETLTGMHCSNPRCKSKVAQRLYALCTNLGVKDLGKKRAETFIYSFGLDNPLLIFAYEPNSDGAMGDGISLDLSNKIMAQFSNKKSFTLSEYVRVANLPYLQTSCVSVFGEYDDLAVAYSDIEQGGVEFIRDKLDIKKGSQSELGDDSADISIRALRVFETLMLYKEDLFQALPYVNIIKVNRNEEDGENDLIYLKAVCSDEVGYPFKTKNDFYSSVNNLYDNVHVEFLSALTKSVDYLVWAGADGKTQARYTNKVKKVEGWNSTYKETGKGKEIPIVTAMEFLSILEKKVKGDGGN